MRKKPISNKSVTNWRRIRTMKDQDLNLSDSPELTPNLLARAVVRRGLKPIKPRKTQFTIRLDHDVLAWYRSRGRGYQTEINALLRAFMETSKPGGIVSRRSARVKL